MFCSVTTTLYPRFSMAFSYRIYGFSSLFTCPETEILIFDVLTRTSCCFKFLTDFFLSIVHPNDLVHPPPPPFYPPHAPHPPPFYRLFGGDDDIPDAEDDNCGIDMSNASLNTLNTRETF
jgi:hypothetical protein